MSLEEFQDRWLNVHGPLVRQLREKLPQMKRYVQSHLIPGEASELVRASRGCKEAYDGITEVWFEDLESMGGSTQESLDAAMALYQDEAEFLDFANSAVFLTEEHEIF